MSQRLDVDVLQVYVSRPQVIQYDGKDLWIAVDEQRAVLVLPRSDAVAQQSGEERVGNPREGRPGRRESAKQKLTPIVNRSAQTKIARRSPSVAASSRR